MRFVFLAPLVLSVAACGGAVDSDLFGDPADAASAKDTGTGVDASQSDGSIDPPDASVVDATPIIDATPITDVSVIDAGPVDPGTLCMTNPNASYCKNETELCCIKPTGSACIASNVANTCSTTKMFCDNGDSCKQGEVCCGSIINNGQQNVYTEIRCSSNCQVTAQQIPGQRRFCNPNNKPDECIANGLACKQSGLLPGYFICQ